ncbi:pseudouridine synthase [Wallemia mellicola]|uniref:Pseudouridine synthase n=1 Tax=Wallemia mellicola TaxID=1708541 RepID=A0A4T0PLD5_9BASI|nr:pseudouridine synthase [Wallemia mellicola]TIC01296.1 pseudouridine synthase [Wallemia mellicola]TIC05478.1 pseudouridine synthase [Wallemia mellicola]TIC11762.1 pseudouridine synthase [Wallemia mellicola]TIC17820.1 pseudouridine synthase [Wallemia mellicola]
MIKPRLEVLFKDNMLLVVNKIPGMLSQAGSHSVRRYCISDESIDNVFQRLSIENYLEDLKYDYDVLPKPLHRLDYNTSGCLMLGRTSRAAKQFSSALANNRVTKEYWGLVSNLDKVYENEGTITHPIALSSSGRPYLGGEQKAHTRWQILRHDPITRTGLCRFIIQTGRKHQIRLHASEALKLPIIGDALYGEGKQSDVLYLHARSLEFERFYKSSSGKAYKSQVKVEAPVPREWTKKMLECKFDDFVDNNSLKGFGLS